MSTPDEIVAGQPDPRLAKKSKDPPKRKTISTSVTPSEPRQPSRKRRLKKKASEAGSSAPMVEQTEGLDDTDMSNFYAELEDCLEGDESIPVKVVFTPTPHFGRSLAQRVSAVGGFVGKTGDEDVRRHVDPLDALANSALSHDAEYDEIQEDDFATASRGEEIDLTRIESLLPLELSNRVNVLSGLLVSHGMQLNTCYANLVASKAHTEENLNRKSGYVKELRSEVATLDKKLERL
ncbi:hypothetical protein Tco_1470349 [Tanacetum coccineum]